MACGVCTVLVDDRPVSACGMPAVDIDGARVRTVEGLGAGGQLDALQRAFVSHVAAQCGYCTPGQLMSATALIDSGPALTRAEIVDWMRTNLCRCGSYAAIVDAIATAHASRWADHHRESEARCEQ
jgi:aerobic-type carbon monoxide dehydrogenase small subunit (CoxS/CutS family)